MLLIKRVFRAVSAALHSPDLEGHACRGLEIQLHRLGVRKGCWG